MMVVTALMLWSAVATPASAKPSDAAANFAQRNFGISNFKRADADLNGDGLPEALIYNLDGCGSGGCTLVILSPKGKTFRVLLRSTVTQLPIRVLSTSTQGWRDIGVSVFGGGITKAYMAQLRFNGRRYPSNPTVAPATPLATPAGKLLIAE
ncbi:hypothetical protein [Sphingomonas sp.]|uniref:hypothetical protein n=1 Tax=Sphingomonas sp. TaxID=28214 RepID=UPI0025F02EA1|nr:hypothetical protein [Sphingomonas sp.]